jgi:ferredoxin
MKKEKESANILSGMPSASATSGITGVSSPSVYNATSTVKIDFRSPEFNRIDDLNDSSANYRLFEPLNDIITSDMRHQMERLREESCSDAPAHEAPASRKKESKVKRGEPEPACDLSPLTVISEGRTLIVDTDPVRAAKCGEILSGGRLMCTLMVIKKTPQDTHLALFNRLMLVEADDVSIAGAFGGFSATLTANGDQRNLSDGFDLVLDLRTTPSFAGRRMPIGYYAPGENQEELKRVMAELPEMRGRFRKPRFTVFLKSLCFHGRSRTGDCRRCVDVCPVDAIQAVRGKISINHYLCQGCGGCALVCPADAIQNVYPPHGEMLDVLRKKLASSQAVTALPTTVVISDGRGVRAEELPYEVGTNGDDIVYFEVEEIGHVGLETILTAFSHGADKVVVACMRENPEGIRGAVAWQVEMARAILKGLDLTEDKCRFVVPAKISSFEDESSAMESFDGETYDGPLPGLSSSFEQQRRALIRLAAKHLYEASDSRKPWISLPAGSPFGAVTVDPGACTLCMACATACPPGALSAGGDVPRLLFVEARCHQCGLCRDTCPEGAIQLFPRMLCDVETMETPVVLCEAEVFRCVKCNTPFAPKKMVNRMTEKLKGHWMYADDRQLRRLKMCRVCRTRDALSSEDVRLWNR